LLTPSLLFIPQEQGLDKNARLSDIQGKPQEHAEKQPPTKKQRVTDKPSPAAGGVSSGEKVRKGTPFPYHPSKAFDRGCCQQSTLNRYLL